MGEIAYFYVVPYLEGAGVGYLVHYALHQRGFSLAVFPDKRHFLAALYGECGMVKHLMVAVCFAQFISYHRIVARTWRRRKLEAEV